MAIIMVVCLLVWFPWQQKAPIDLEMVKLHFYAPPQKWQVYYVIPSEILCVRLSVQGNIQGLGAILDIIMRYFEVYSI